LKPGLVSVVVASYNHAEFLPQRMESLLGQGYANLEILVIDDCSPDNSVEVLRRYVSDPRVRLVEREQNGGWVAVSNQGVEMAAGEYVIFANCDDACEPDMIERLVTALERHPSAGIAFCRSLLVDAHGRILGDDYAVREASFRVRCAADTLITGPEMSRFLLHSCVIPNLSAALIRKACFVEVGNLSAAYRANSDWDLFFRIAARYDVAYVAAPLNRFRQHETTIRSVTKGRVTYEEFFRLLLGRIRTLDLSFRERCRYRMRVMSLWGHHVVTQPLIGLRNFPYHLGRILVLDAPAILFLVPAVVEFAVTSLARVLKRSGDVRRA
jgi:glycosyltransferase involved in cell wall biosynthesis